MLHAVKYKCVGGNECFHTHFHYIFRAIHLTYALFNIRFMYSSAVYFYCLIIMGNCIDYQVQLK